MKRFVSILLPAALTVLVMTAGGAMPAALRRDAASALRDVATRAAQGDPESMFRLARVCERGYDSIPRDTVEALRLYSASAEGGWLPAMNYLGYMLITGRGVARDASAGLHWIERAAMAGDATAQSNVGFLLVNGDGVERDPEKGAYWLGRAAEAGVAPAQSMLGDLYLKGEGVVQDSLRAEKYYYAALDGGLTDAAYKIENMMRDRWMTMPDSVMLRKAIYFYRHGAPDVGVPILRRIARADSLDNHTPETELNVTDSISNAASLALLGDAYTRAQGVRYDYDKSTYYYYKAALAGNPAAAFIISELLEIFPDAIDRYISDNDHPEHKSAAYWRGKARMAAVTSAEEATRRLFDP